MAYSSSHFRQQQVPFSQILNFEFKSENFLSSQSFVQILNLTFVFIFKMNCYLASQSTWCFDSYPGLKPLCHLSLHEKFNSEKTRANYQHFIVKFCLKSRYYSRQMMVLLLNGSLSFQISSHLSYISLWRRCLSSYGPGLKASCFLLIITLSKKDLFEAYHQSYFYRIKDSYSHYYLFVV